LFESVNFQKAAKAAAIDNVRSNTSLIEKECKMAIKAEHPPNDKIVIGVTEKKIGNTTFVITKTQSPKATKTLDEKLMSYLLRSPD